MSGLTAAEHAAAVAWHGLGSGRPDPSGVEPVKVKGASAKTAVYRLLGATEEGAPVIAKRCSAAVRRLERVMYEDVLPLLAISRVRYYGAIEDDERRVWIFLEDVGSERLSPVDPEHRTLAARWLGMLHSGAAELPLSGRLPDHGPRRYRRHLAAGRRLILENLRNGGFRTDEVALLRAIADQCDAIERRWSELEEICAAAPSTVVHGDFRPKNVFVGGEPDRRRLLVIDWETCGWGAPAVDLAPARSTDPPYVNLNAYCRVVQERWPGFDGGLARRLSRAGLIFRQLAAIEWAAASKVCTRVPGVATHLEGLRVYHQQLEQALTDRCWARRD